MNLILLGAPGSGKGTLSIYLKNELNCLHLATGDLVSDEITVEVVRQKLDSLKGESYILDGFPRNLYQAETLDNFASIDKVILLDVPQDILLKRIIGRRSCPKCGSIYNTFYKIPKEEGICDLCQTVLTHRSDDREEAVQNRLDIYNSETFPLIEYYQKEGKLHSIDGTQSSETVLEQAIALCS